MFTRARRVPTVDRDHPIRTRGVDQHGRAAPDRTPLRLERRAGHQQGHASPSHESAAQVASALSGARRFLDMTGGTLDDQLAALVGRPISDGGPSRAPDPVNEPMIRHWAAAFDDWNPIYTDPDAAS